MSNYKYNPEIDEWDLGRIIQKINDLKLVKDWLKQLSSLDSSVVENNRYKPIIEYLTTKIKTLEKKRTTAEKEMIELAEVIANAYKNG